MQLDTIYILKQMSPLVAMAAACNEPLVRVCADPRVGMRIIGNKELDFLSS